MSGEEKKPDSARLGQMGEQWVRERLEKQGVEILAANWHCPWGEIDLIAANETTIAFVEVKTRASAVFALPREAVGRSKQEKLIRSAQQWLMEHPEEQRQPRFDVAEVFAPMGIRTAKPKIVYLPNAFEDWST